MNTLGQLVTSPSTTFSHCASAAHQLQHSARLNGCFCPLLLLQLAPAPVQYHLVHIHGRRGVPSPISNGNCPVSCRQLHELEPRLAPWKLRSRWGCRSSTAATRRGRGDRARQGPGGKTSPWQPVAHSAPASSPLGNLPRRAGSGGWAMRRTDSAMGGGARLVCPAADLIGEARCLIRGRQMGHDASL